MLIVITKKLHYLVKKREKRMKKIDLSTLQNKLQKSPPQSVNT